VWTCEDGWTYAGTLEIGDHVVALGGATVEIVGLTLDETPTFVYNFEVDGTFTYFAHDVWVHNNSCNLEELHHVWPMFLGGASSGLRVGLSQEMHQEFHRVLLGALNSRGLKLSGKLGDNWRNLLRNEATTRKALDALTEACIEFDREHGTMLYELLNRVAGQG
jgi:hypothetical protein